MFDVVVSLTHNKLILRVVCAYALFTVNEYSVWIAILVYAYAKGGATEAGVVAVIQLVPAGLCAPFMAVRADRSAPTILMLAGFAAQIVGLAVAAVAVLQGGPSPYVYAGAIVAASALTATRPAQAALLPSLARTPDELTAANVAMSWVESVGVAVAGVWSAALLTRGVGQVLVAAIVLLAVAAWSVAGIARREPARADGDGETSSTLAEVVDGFHTVREAPGAGTLIVLLGAQDVVLGALDVLFVVVAIGVLDRSQSWAGYLNVDLEVARGETLAIMGPSGCGKSTLLHLLGGLDRPSGGELWLDGRRIDQLSERGLANLRRREVGFVFQAFHLMDELTAQGERRAAGAARRTLASPGPASAPSNCSSR